VLVASYLLGWLACGVRAVGRRLRGRTGG
jgi:hypothetical protein